MKKIIITEKQVALLKKLNLITEEDESGVKSVGVSIGEKLIRIVISGENVPKLKDRILQLISRQDKEARVGFFEATGKLVGTVKDIRFDSIIRDIKSLDPTINVENKPMVKALKESEKKVIKITKEQYDRLFTTPITESNDVKGGINRVDKTFKKDFPIGDVKNLGEESNFNINKPNNEIPRIPKHSERKPPLAERQGLNLFDIIAKYIKDPNDIENEISRYEQMGYNGLSTPLQAQLSRDMDFITFTQMGHDRDQHRKELGETHLGRDEYDQPTYPTDYSDEESDDIISPSGAYSKDDERNDKELNETQQILNSVITKLIHDLYKNPQHAGTDPFWKDHGVTPNEIISFLKGLGLIIPVKDGTYTLAKKFHGIEFKKPEDAIKAVESNIKHLIKQDEPAQLETEDSNLPIGAETDSAAPFNKPEPIISKPKIVKNKQYETIAMNSEIAFVKDIKGKLYVIDYGNMDKKLFEPYAEIEKKYVGKDDERNPDFDLNQDWDITGDVITNFINDNMGRLTTGQGVDDFERGVNLVKVDSGLKQELLGLYDKDNTIVSVLSSIEEDLSHSDIIKTFNKQLAPPTNTEKKTPEAIKAALAKIRDTEVARRKTAGEIEEEKTKKTNAYKDIINKIGPDKIWLNPYNKAKRKTGGYEVQIRWPYLDEVVKILEDNGFDVIDISVGFDRNNKAYTRVIKKRMLEMTSAGASSTGGSSGPFTGPLNMPVVKRKMPDVPVVAEMTSGSDSVGAYDANALVNIDRNGEFKKNPKKTNAQVKTQYPKGGFVKINNCTKYNNNKSAQNGGCSQGAANNVVTVKNTKNSVISPSLDENVKLAPWQAEQLKRINNATLVGVVKHLNKLKVTPDTVAPQFKISNWWGKIDYDNNTHSWVPISNNDAIKGLAIHGMYNVNEKVVNEVAKKTGKTVEEVKSIINSKIKGSK